MEEGGEDKGNWKKRRRKRWIDRQGYFVCWLNQELCHMEIVVRYIKQLAR